MAAYADYIFYTEEYLHGREAVIEAASFDFFAFKATYVIKQYTLDNIPDNIPECVKMCCCEVAELLYRYDDDSSSYGISSESVGDISRSYENTSEYINNLNRNIKNCISMYLGGAGFLYRGVYD